jgi:hypothetical protein
MLCGQTEEFLNIKATHSILCIKKKLISANFNRALSVKSLPFPRFPPHLVIKLTCPQTNLKQESWCPSHWPYYMDFQWTFNLKSKVQMVQTLNYCAGYSLLKGINLKRDTDFRIYPWIWNTVHQKAPSFALHSDHMIWRCPKIHHHSKQNAVFVTTASLLSAGMLQGYTECGNIHYVYYQGYFLYMTCTNTG